MLTVENHSGAIPPQLLNEIIVSLFEKPLFSEFRYICLYVCNIYVPNICFSATIDSYSICILWVNRGLTDKIRQRTNDNIYVTVAGNAQNFLRYISA